MAGFFSRLFSSGRTDAEPATRIAPTAATNEREIAVSFHEDLEVSGEAYHRDGIGRIFRSLGRAEGGVTMQTAHLIPEPENKYDRTAVRVIVMGEQVGHVPQEASAAIFRICAGIGRGNVATVLARIWARNDEGTWRARVTLMFSGERETEKDYAAERLEAEAYYAEREAERERKTADRAAREAEKEARRTAGAVDGQYWPLLKPSIAELKRQKRFEEARDLLEQCIDAAERESVIVGSTPDPWPSEQISVVLRRLKEYSQELAYLERYVAACGDRDAPESVMARLSRSRLSAERDQAGK
ncbi:hypothetical protein FB389_0960 [Rarobacter incanus]|uniref:HIRAN domain-containing protein n=1 Tax=Rarobacter incanus TaxID=153494 RepID=A0A542SPV3_9MICO|nr:hypothetical protein FB389_0960 [Rarobacter incanus]